MRRVSLYVFAITLFAGGGIFLAMQLYAFLDNGSFRGLLNYFERHTHGVGRLPTLRRHLAAAVAHR